ASGQQRGSFLPKPAYVLIGVLIGPKFLTRAAQRQKGIILLATASEVITKILHRTADSHFCFHKPHRHI
ncbi:MAG: hypothetical protein WBV63_06135, partial [Candidatus Sulfotelmatobacter sp.]